MLAQPPTSFRITWILTPGQRDFSIQDYSDALARTLGTIWDRALSLPND